MDGGRRGSLVVVAAVVVVCEGGVFALQSMMSSADEEEPPPPEHERVDLWQQTLQPLIHLLLHVAPIWPNISDPPRIFMKCAVDSLFRAAAGAFAVMGGSACVWAAT
ncbi:unnamed protein product [Heligmosomoides polygyrus]|uniref:Uncharacterized protein n=1 Tax=Heligmosomoides polygyrus TaxID=6339 RepID=A0A183G7G7_HELPZ|nr:unnamed protein product [Heligmosomoides polygyrus]